jgi:tetratricopeptide (TPR) repeat protein
MRERELEAGRVIVRAVITAQPFLLRRAAVALSGLDGSPARRPLRHAAHAALDGDGEAALGGLVGYGALLERHGEFAEAEAVYASVLPLRTGDPCVALHAARAARKAGHMDAALAFYREAGERAGGNAEMAFMIGIGEALVSPDPEAGLTAIIGRARQARSRDVVAVALEERARLRSAGRRSPAAIRDLVHAAARFRDRQDRVRVLHRLGELLSARGDLPAAREALLAALDITAESHRPHTVQRLRTVARAMGDDVGLRRTRGQGTASLVCLAPAPRARTATRSLLRHLRSLRERLLQAP